MSSLKDLWDKLTGKGVSEAATEQMRASTEQAERRARERELAALDSAAESSGDPRLYNLAAERRSSLQEAEDFHRSIGG